MDRPSRELHNTNYELFILAISILSLLNMAFIWLFPGRTATGVVAIINGMLTVFFLLDFVLRFVTAESKFRYFFIKFGWADLLGSLWLPGFRLFRLFRIVRVLRLMHRQYGIRSLIRTYRSERANSALGTLTFFIILVLEFGGTAVLYFERASHKANIDTAGEALWWGVVTIATVGYGDYYPITTGGRVVGVMTIIAGVGLFGVVTGFLANAFLSPPWRRAGQPTPANSADQQAVLAEVQRLAAEHDRDNADLQGRLERIEALLANVPAAGQPGADAETRQGEA